MSLQLEQFFDDRCANCQHDRRNHSIDGTCYVCPPERRCRAFQAKEDSPFYRAPPVPCNSPSPYDSTMCDKPLNHDGWHCSVNVRWEVEELHIPEKSLCDSVCPFDTLDRCTEPKDHKGWHHSTKRGWAKDD